MEKFTAEVNPYWSLEDMVSSGFNRLKAKLFNLVEASVVDKSQVTAIKGLIKGFANDEYKIVLENMRDLAKEGKLIENEDLLPVSAEPLEVYQR